MYRPSGDGPQFRPVPAAPLPPRVMGGPFSLPPPGHPPLLGPVQGRPPVMQQLPVLPQYSYPPPGQQPLPPVLGPPPVSLRPPVPSMHPSLPSMQSSSPSLQRPLPPPSVRPNMPPSLPPPHPLLPQPPPQMLAGFQSMQPSLPSVRPVPVQFQSPLVQAQLPLSFTSAPLPSIQPAPFLPPLPPSPPSDNPPPPPPPSPPPQSPPLPHIEGSSSSVADLLPPEPPKPTDPEMLKNIDVLAAFVVKNGPRFESMARARQAGDPKFAFLFESDAAPEAAIGHEFYKWKKQSLALELGLNVEIKKSDQADAGAVSGRVLHTKGSSLLPGDMPASPAVSDMDMEDDFIPSPVKEPVQQIGTGSSLNGKGYSESTELPTIEGHVLKKDTEVHLINGMPSPEINNGVRSSNLLERDEQRPRNGRSGMLLNNDDGMDEIIDRIPNLSSEKTLLNSQSRSEIAEVLQEPGLERQEHRTERVSRWESLPSSCSSPPRSGGEDRGDMNAEVSSSPRHENSINNISADRIDVNDESNIENGESVAISPVRQNQETVTVDEFGRMVRKETVESDSDVDMRRRKRRRGYSRSRSRSRSRGRSRSRSRNRNRSRSRSRSQSYSPGEPRWKRQAFSRSPPRRGRWSRSRSRSPHWQRNDSRSPPRDRWGGVGRGDRDWRGERESFGRGRRGGRGSGPSVCFHYARGRCFRGSACKFLHPERETAQERGMQSADPHASVLKDVDTTRSRPYMSVDPGSHTMQGDKDECTAQRAALVRDKNDPSQDLDTIVSEEGRIQTGQPTRGGDSAFGTVKQAAKSLECEDWEMEGHVDEPEIAEASNVMRLETDLRKSKFEHLGSVKDDSIVRDSLVAEESKRRDTAVNETANETNDDKATEQEKDQKKELISTNGQSRVVQGKVSVMNEKDKLKPFSDGKVPEIKAEKPNSLSGAELSDYEGITPRESAEGEVDKSGAEGDATSLRPPLISGAPFEGSSSSPSPSSQEKVTTKVAHVASPSLNENLLREQSVLAQKNLDPAHYSTAVASQVPSSYGTNLSIRNSFSMSSSSLGQQMPVPNLPVHASLHNQSGHGASVLHRCGTSDITRQHSPIVSQERLPNFEVHHSGQFASNLPVLQQLGNRPQSSKEPWELGASFSLPKEEPTYSRLFDNNARQYTRSGPSGDVLQHAYSTSNALTSAASTHSSFPWNESTSTASRSMLSSNADQSHYSYTLTTIPPLPCLIKLPGVSNVSGNEQYDPLSDGLDPGSSRTLKSSTKPSVAERPVGVGFLENLSPGLDAEKATVLASATDGDTANMNEAATDVGVVENVSPPGEWSPVQPGDGANVVHDHSKNKKSNRGLKLLRTAVADRVKVLLKPAWKEGRLSKDAFKTIAKKAVEKVTGNLPNHHIPKSQEKVDQYMAVSSSKIARLVQGYVEKYSKAQN